MHDEQYLPPMGRRWLLPLYDPISRFAGVSRVHGELLDRADPRPGQSVLDIGCGTGSLLLALARRPGVRLAGVDPDPGALARARRKARRAGVPLDLRRAFAGELPQADGSVDRVLSSFTLHHLDDAELARAAAEARRVLAPGGELHVVDVSGPPDGHRHGIRRNGRLSGSLAGRVVTALGDAGLSGAAETGGGALRLGTYAFYRAARR